MEYSASIGLDVGLKIQMEVASSRPDHLPTLSAAKTSELSLLVKSPFWWRNGRCRQYCSHFLLQCAGDIKTDHTDSELLWTAPAKTMKHLILAIDETCQQQRHVGLNEAMNHLAMTNSVHWYGHV